MTKKRNRHILFDMKKYVFLFAMSFLAACSTCGDEQTDTILNLARPASIGMLQGKTQQQITALLGEPTFVRTEAPHQTWVFKAPDCALFVFFDAQGTSCYTETKGSCSKEVARRMIAEKSTML